MPTPFDAILDQSRDLIVERLGEAMSAMLDKADESLLKDAEKAQGEEQGYLMVTRDVVAKHRSDIESEFRDYYLEEFASRVREVRQALGNTRELAEEPMEMELELVGEEDLTETLRFNDMVARLRRACDSELGALDQRASVLLGDATLQAEQNPFGAQAICGAYKSVCKHVDADVKIRRVLVKLFDEHVAGEVRAIYHEVNELLIDNSILPKIRYVVPKNEGGAAGAAEDEQESDVEEAVEAKVRKATDAAAAAGQDIFSILSKLMGPGGSGAAAAAGGASGAAAGAGATFGGGAGAGPAPGTPGGPPALEGVALMSSLTQLQHGNVSGITTGSLVIPEGYEAVPTNVLAQLKQTNVGASMGQVDAMTLDIVSMLFDQIFDDPKVPAGVKALVGRLQIPILKIAIADKEIFSKKDHPARVMLDILGDFAARLPADFDRNHPIYPRLDAVLLGLIEAFDDKVETVLATNEKLRALAAEEDARQAKEDAAAAKLVDKRERLALARNSAQEEIKKRYVEGKTQRPVLDFLVNLWVKPLLIAHLQDGPEGPAWRSAVETMDLLTWSVEPKTDPVERKKLATTVPKLLKDITTGLVTSGVDANARTAFFAQLMNMHTAVLHTNPEAVEKEKAKQAAREARRAARAAAAAAADGTAPAPVVKQPPPAPKPPPPVAKPEAPATKAITEVTDTALLDFTAPIMVRIGNEVVEVEKSDELDFVAAAATTAKEGEPALEPVTAAGTPGAKPELSREVKLPTKLKEGTWVGIRAKGPDEARQPAKLLYVSPLKSRFLFADKRGKTVLECTRVDLARRFKLRELVIIAGNPDGSFFERIINSVLAKLGHAPA